MHRFNHCLIVLALLWVTSPASSTAADEPRPDQAAEVSYELATPWRAALCADPARQCRATPQRRAIGAEIAHYSLEVPVGLGMYDRIVLHRVVRESSPGRPAPTHRGVLLVHGDGGRFASNFLPTVPLPGLADERSLAIFLARRGIDVWGIDFRWTRVLSTTTDLSFMADWGMERHIADLDVAFTAARLVRGFTGSGFGRLHLLGFSRGAQIGYGYLNAETQQPPFRRHSRGFIVLDVPYLAADDTSAQRACERVESIEADLDDGFFADDLSLFRVLGDLAAADPASPSPFIPGLSNLEAALFFGSTDSLIGYHLVGGLPTQLFYTEPSLWLATMQASTAWSSPLPLQLQIFQLRCGEVDLPFDDHLADVTVPALYLGAAGGLGASGLASLEALGSTDVTTRVVALLAPEERAFDLGHLDTLLATDADQLFWTPIANWIEAH
ncbi:MAG: hypothetical protein AAF657_06240 [Acidobacteriota bacterium]